MTSGQAGTAPTSISSTTLPLSPAAPSRTYISFVAEIAPKTVESLMAVLAQQVAQKVDEIYLMLTTPGGNVMHGIALYNFLRSMPFKLIVHNSGSVNSIGNAIFLAGQERYACANSTFMFHGVGFDITDKMRLEEKFLRERLDAIQNDQRRIGQIITDNTSLDQGAVANLFLEAQTKDAAYARTNGIIHDIRDIQIPKGASVLQLVFQR
jgi:ATP-dependent Clp protease protease subunit